MSTSGLHLAIDTATARPLVAILQGDKCLHDWQGREDARHHETLLLGIEECFQVAGVGKRDLQFLSVGIGPGMFTGLRIGISTAQFLADTLKIPCVAVSSSMALAYQGVSSLAPEKNVWALLDARSKRVYALRMNRARFAADFSPPEGEEVAVEPAVLIPSLQSGDVLLGEGALVFRDTWPDSVTISENPNLRCEFVGKIGWNRYQAGLTIDPKNLLPTYLKTGQSHL